MFESWPDSALFILLMLCPVPWPLPNLRAPTPVNAFYPDVCAGSRTGKCVSACRAACSEAKGFPGCWEMGRQSRVQ